MITTKLMLFAILISSIIVLIYSFILINRKMDRVWEKQQTEIYRLKRLKSKEYCDESK